MDWIKEVLAVGYLTIEDMADAIRAEIEKRFPKKRDVVTSHTVHQPIGNWVSIVGCPTCMNQGYNQSCEDHHKALLSQGKEDV